MIMTGLQRKKVLIVEDEEPLRELYQRRLNRKDYYTKGAASAEEAWDILEKEDFHVALVDIKLPGLSGIDFLESIKKNQHYPEIIMLTAHGSIESAVRAMKLGAYDYLTKPCHLPELEIIVEKAFEKHSIQYENILLKEELKTKDAYDSLVYQSPSMNQLLENVKKIARTDSPVLLEGESGTGKELIANTIHKLSPRKIASFIVVNCANLQENLVENELFGHEKGAYTGADQKRRGLIELAQGGTLFIDEVAEMHLSVQAKLLRVLENKCYRRVGGDQEIHADVRIIAATNQNLTLEISRGRFRKDLFFRLNTMHLILPPLRERREDIPPLIDYFIKKKTSDLKMKKKISPSTRKLLIEYDWPGNVRELANVIERAVILSSGDYIEPEDLPFGKKPEVEREFLPLSEVERNYIHKVLDGTDGNKTLTAKILQISVRNLYRKLDQYRETEDKSFQPEGALHI
jgi:two-component system, NtrC family, response regulator AtoC